MARYDKYDPVCGGFRAKLNANLPLGTVLTLGTNGGTNNVNGVGPVGVSLNASGKLVIGTAGGSGLVGVLVKNAARGPLGRNFTDLYGGSPVPVAPMGCLAGDIVDVMTAGEINDLDPTVWLPGKKVYANADGSLTFAFATGGIPVGFVLEAGHFVVRVAAGAPAAA